MPLAHQSKLAGSPVASARSTPSRPTSKSCRPPPPHTQLQEHAATVSEKIEEAQRRRLEKEQAGPPPKKVVAVSALEKAQAAARKEADWRAGAAERAAVVREQRMAQLAEAEAEEAAERAREAAQSAAIERHAAEQREAETRQRAQAEREATRMTEVAAAEAALDPFGSMWRNVRRPETPSGDGSVNAGAAAAGGTGRRLASASHSGDSIENGNRLGERPVVRQSKIYRQNESGNSMKAALGHDDLKWETDHLQGVFAGQGVYDAESNATCTVAKSDQAHRAPPKQKSHLSKSPAAGVKGGGSGSIPRDDTSAALGPLQQAAAARKAKLDKMKGAQHSLRGGTSPHPASPRPPSARSREPRGASEPHVGDLSSAAAYGYDRGSQGPIPAAAPSALERMQLLKGLFDDGLVTQAEFDAKRAAIIDAL